MICWYCYWGWPKPIAEIYMRARADIDAIGWDDGEHALHFGPAHIVWEDENWDDNGWCLANCDNPMYSDWDAATLDIVRRSLQELMALPTEIRRAVPAGYDGENPANFPPTVEMTRDHEKAVET